MVPGDYNKQVFYYSMYRMAQVGIREYDAKVLFSQYRNIPYNGILITSKDEINTISDTAKSYTVKPDQLFGKEVNIILFD